MTNANYNELIWGLEELASKELQLRLWCGFENNSNEISSLSEVRCSIFNYDVSRILDGQLAFFRLSEKSVSKLRELRKMLKSIPSNVAPVEQVEHNNMPEIRTLAEALVGELKA